MKWQDILVAALHAALTRVLPMLLAALAGATLDGVLLSGAVGHAARIAVVGP